MSKNSSTFHPNQIVPPRVRRGGDSAVALWQALSSAMMAWVLPEVLVGLVWEYSFSRIPQGILYLDLLFFFLHLSPGRFVRSLGKHGTQPGQFNYPGEIVATDECVLVVDLGNERCNLRVCLQTNGFCL
jgi:hypothetical protein